MSPLRRGLALSVALLGFAALASGAEAKVKRHHLAPQRHYGASAATSRDFPVYVGTGVDRNPGGDNLYFSDTKRPSYIVGPAWFQRWE
jgi:hypothetical protein